MFIEVSFVSVLFVCEITGVCGGMVDGSVSVTVPTTVVELAAGAIDELETGIAVVLMFDDTDKVLLDETGETDVVLPEVDDATVEEVCDTFNLGISGKVVVASTMGIVVFNPKTGRETPVWLSAKDPGEGDTKEGMDGKGVEGVSDRLIFAEEVGGIVVFSISVIFVVPETLFVIFPITTVSVLKVGDKVVEASSVKGKVPFFVSSLSI